MHIRIALPSELSAIQDVLIAVGPIIERARITATFESSTYWVAVDESTETVIGCIGLEHGIGASLLRSAAVYPQMQGRGVGHNLAAIAIDASVERGDKMLYLFSTSAGEFWRRFGFAEVSVWAVAEALPTAPQVISGLTRGWLVDDCAWALHNMQAHAQS